MTLTVGFDLCRAALAVTGISAPEQSVLTVLAIMANDQAQCWPGIAGLVARTKLSERAVQNATKALEEARHIKRDMKPGRGIVYSIHPRTECTPQEVHPAGDAPPQEVRGAGGAATPAGGAPKQPRTTIPKKASPSRGARKPKREPRPGVNFHRLPVDWKPERFGEGSAARGAVDRRGQPWAKARLEDFRSWAANAEDKDGKGRKLDWQQAFAKWINEHDREERSGEGSRRVGAGSGSSGDGFLDAVREARANRTAADSHGVP